MDLNQLRSFVAVAKAGHLTRAAETLHLSQPALSGQIKSLEEDFGVTLFERSSAGMALTPSGRQAAEAGRTRHRGSAGPQALRAAAAGRTHRHDQARTVLDPGFLTRRRTAGADVRTPSPARAGTAPRRVQRCARCAFAAARWTRASISATAREDLHSIPLRKILYRVAMPEAWADELVAAPWEAIAARPWVLAPEPSSHGRLVMDLFRAAVGAAGANHRGRQRVGHCQPGRIRGRASASSATRSRRNRQVRDAVRSGRAHSVTTELWLVHSADRIDDPLLSALVEVLLEIWEGAMEPEAQGV